jgi:2-succinyl-6-hydroxy-2,4-cyclohexadiene-1-carboxylate synthase
MEKGPVHINVPISEPIYRFTAKELPIVRTITRYQGLNVYDRDYNELIERLNKYTKRMAIVGQMNLIYLFEKRYVKPLAKNFAWLTEHLSNRTVPGYAIKNFDAAIYSMTPERKEDMRPELLITYGGHIVSKQLKKYLRENPPKEHWHISKDGKVADLYGCLNTVIEMEPFEFLEKMAFLLNGKNTNYPLMWENYCKTIPEPTLPYSEISVIGELIKKLPQPAALHLANSSTVRYAQLFSIPNDTEICCNRGVNGIEGSLSTAIGYAAASDKINFIVIGDLSFFYDMNALWGSNFRGNIRILLLNNEGGEIFNTLPGMDNKSQSRQFITAEHHTSARGWAEERGFKYFRIDNQEEFNQNIDHFVSAEESVPMIMEVFTDKEKDTTLLKEYYHSIKNRAL